MLFGRFMRVVFTRKFLLEVVASRGEPADELCSHPASSAKCVQSGAEVLVAEPFCHVESADHPGSFFQSCLARLTVTRLAIPQ